MEIENSQPYFFGDIGENEMKTTWPGRLSLSETLTQFDVGVFALSCHRLANRLTGVVYILLQVVRLRPVLFFFLRFKAYKYTVEWLLFSSVVFCM